MLLGRPTKYAAGITIAGDYVDLCDLHETIHHLASETGPLAPGHDEFVLGLAYDVRHAYQGERGTEPAGEHGSSAPYYCFDTLWPVFLVQLGMLRVAAGYLPTSRAHQANLYRLEACAESALKAFDPAVGAICTRWLSQFAPLPDNFLLEYISHQARTYVFASTAGKARYRHLPTVLDDISILSHRYRDFERQLSEQAAKEGCKPHDLTDLSEWPAFKW